MQLNKLLSVILSLILCISAFVFPFMKATKYSYAINDDILWQPLNSENELVDAFQAYCKSRDLTIEGSVADAVTTATTGSFNGICNKLGIDITALQADIKKSTDSMGNIQFLFDSNGITAYNRIFAQFLQDNELSVGDSADQANNTIYNGELFSDDDGNKCLVTLYRSGTGDNIVQLGTAYKYTGKSLSTLTRSNSYSYSDTLHINHSNYTLASTFDYEYSKAYCFLNVQYSGRFKISNGANSYSEVIDNSYGFLSVGKVGTSYYLGWYVPSGNGDINYNRFNERISINGNSPVNVFVFLNTNNTVINNNTYEGDTIINQYGTPSDPNNPDDPDDPYDPDYDPYPDGGGTTTGPNNTGGGSGEDDTDITFPDFDFHLPEIDWSLGDLSNKFPFSIPFDLIAFFTVLNAAPEAPAIDAEIPLGDWYTWHFEADFSQFDNYAAIIRNVEFIAFCIGLIYLTIRLVKG